MHVPAMKIKITTHFTCTICEFIIWSHCYPYISGLYAWFTSGIAACSVGVIIPMVITLHCLLQTTHMMKRKKGSEVTQSCQTLCDPMDCGLPGSSVHGILQAGYWSEPPFPPPGDLHDPGAPAGITLHRCAADTHTWSVHCSTATPKWRPAILRALSRFPLSNSQTWTRNIIELFTRPKSTVQNHLMILKVLSVNALLIWRPLFYAHKTNHWKWSQIFTIS